jgi:ERCC4-type nuclease
MTDKRLKEILQAITVIIDTREQENSHITGYFRANRIHYVERALKFGDYSFECPTIPELGFTEPFSFEQRIVVERKNSLDELSGNLAQARERFERELEKARECQAKLILMCENGSWDKIIEHKYRTDMNERSYLGTLFSFSHRYDVQVQFVPSKYAGMFIFSQFYYFLRNELRQMEAPATV